MKVLMLGWEFPPHISGGLGTACAGLTQALGKEDVDILFVIPKLHGGEKADKTTFISASSVPIRQKKFISKDVEVSGDTKLSFAMSHPDSPAPSDHRKKRSGAITTVEVSSFLSPYHQPDEKNQATGLTHWSYTFPEKHTSVARASAQKTQDLRTPPSFQKYTKEPYAFSGTYGANLFDEADRYAQVVAEIAKRNTFDVIHAHDWMTFKAGIAAGKASGKPLVVHVHATEIDRSGAHVNSRVYAIEREGMITADKVVAVSQWTKDIAVKNYHISPEKIEVVHNGISPKPGVPVQPFAPPLGSKIVTFLGRVTRQKGPMYFVEAARKVLEKFPETHFVVAGAGDQLPAMIERIAQLRMSANFHFTGFLKGEDIDRIWAMSSVYVMPSVSEPFGIAPLEAIQAGVPVILSRQAGVGEVMPHAMKVNFWDTEAFAEAICSLLRFKSLANTLRKNGSEEIKSITWEKAAKKLTALYYDLTKSNSTSKEKKSGVLLPGPPTEKTSRAAVL